MKMVTKKPVVRKGTAKELKGLEKKIGKVPKFFKELTANDPDMYNLVMKFEGHVWDDGRAREEDKEADRDCDCCGAPGPACGPRPV